MSKNQQINDPFKKLLLNSIQEENIDLTRQLLANKNFIKLEEINEISDSAFNYLAKNGNIEIAKLLINHNFKLNQESNSLHIACEYGNLDLVKLLVNSFKIKLNVTDKLNMTPLHRAVEYGHYETVNYILKHHLDEIDLEFVDKLNRTVHELALIKRNHRIINLIEEKIKKSSSASNFFNKTQFNIKSFAKSYPKANQQEQQSKRVINIHEEEYNASNFDGPLSSSPNSQQMNETLNWLENQIYAQTNTNLNTSTLTNVSSIDLLDEIKNGRELVLTEAGKQLLLLTDETESTKNLLEKLAKSYETKQNVNINESKLNIDEEGDDDEDDLYMTNVVKRCRFSNNSPISSPNQFDIDLDSFLNNFLNSR